MARLFIVSLFILTASPVFALIEPTALCGVKSVLPSGFIDTTRNPALIPFNSGSSVGAGGVWTANQEMTVKMHTKSNSMSNFGQTGKDKADVIADGAAGFLFRFAHSGIGLAAAACGDSLYESRTFDSTLSGYMTNYNMSTGATWSQDLSDTAHTTDKITSPAFAAAWGWSSSDNFSWGISVLGGPTKEIKESFTAGTGVTTYSGTATPFMNSLKEKTTTKGYSGRICLGFAYRDENLEAGFLLTSSDISQNSISYAYSYDGSSTTLIAPTATGTKKADNPLSMDGPPSLTVGFRYMTGSIDFVGETSILSSGSRSVKSISFNYDSNSAVISSKEVETTVNASAKGGIVLHPFASARFIAGCGYEVEGRKENENGNGSQSKSNSEMFSHIVMASGGAEFSLGGVTLGGAVLYGKIISNGRYWSGQEGLTARYSGSALKIAGGASVSF